MIRRRSIEVPCRADILAATPKCPLEVGLRKRQCAAPMEYDRGKDVWVCAVHGPAVTHARLVARQTLAA